MAARSARAPVVEAHPRQRHAPGLVAQRRRDLLGGDGAVLDGRDAHLHAEPFEREERIDDGRVLAREHQHFVARLPPVRLCKEDEAVGRIAGEADLGGIGREQCGHLSPDAVDPPLEPGMGGVAVVAERGCRADHPIAGGGGQQAIPVRCEVSEPLERGEERPRLLGGQRAVSAHARRPL